MIVVCKNDHDECKIDKMAFVVGRNYFILLEKHLLMGPCPSV